MNNKINRCNKSFTICHIASGDLWAGAEVQIFNIVRGLRRVAQLEIIAIVMNKGKLYSELSKLGIKVYLVDEKRNNLLKQFIMMRKIIMKYKIEVLHSHRYKENIFGAFLKLSCVGNFELIKTQHGLFNIKPNWRMRIYKTIDQCVTKMLFKSVIGVSKDIASQFNFLGTANKVNIIHNSICFDKYEVVSENPKTYYSNRWRLKIAIVARLVKIKNIDEFIRLISFLKRDVLKVDAVIAGDGPERGRLESLTEEYSVVKNITFLGNIDNISEVYNSIDILFISSFHEGLPTVLLEAMYFKKIVVSRAIGGIPEVISHGENGFLYNKLDEAINIIRNINKDPLSFQFIRENARETIESKYNFINQAQNYTSLYQSCLERR